MFGIATRPALRVGDNRLIVTSIRPALTIEEYAEGKEIEECIEGWGGGDGVVV